MTIFPMLKTEDVVQVDDLIRLSAVGSFVSGPDRQPITKIEIEPDTGKGFTDVFDEDRSAWYLDWVYDTNGEKTVTVRVTVQPEVEEGQPAAEPVVATRSLKVRVLTAAEDYLFSNDNDLKTLEPDIMNWLPEGYSSWNHIHRQAQRNIMDWLDEIRVYKADGESFVAKDLSDREQVRRLSKLTALRMIFSQLSNQNGDVFQEKADKYESEAFAARNRNSIALDTDGDGSVDTPRQDLRTVAMVRR